jgi:hypothetical protein
LKVQNPSIKVDILRIEIGMCPCIGKNLASRMFYMFGM